MKKALILNYLMRGAMFTLIVGGLAHALFSSLFLPFSIWFTMASTAFMYVVLSFFLWNLWTSLLIFPATVITGFIYAYYYFPENWIPDLFLRLDLIVSYILGYGALDLGNMVYMAWLLILLLSLVIYALAILLEWFFPTLLVGLAIAGTQWYLGHVDMLSYIWPFALGMILMLADKHRQYLNKNQSSPDYGRWQLSVLPLAIAIILTASFALPRDTRGLKLHFMQETVWDINDTLWDWFSPTVPGTGFRLWQTGFSASSGRLGGPVILNHDIALHVSSPRRVLLRGALLNEYTGYGWNATTDDRNYLFEDRRQLHTKNKAFDIDEPVIANLNNEQLMEFFTPLEIEITHAGIVTSVLFNAKQLRHIGFDDRTPNVFFTTSGETFIPEIVSEHESYSLEVLLPEIDSIEFQQYLNNLPILDWSIPLPHDLAEYGLDRRKLLDIQRYYTQLPDTVTDRTRELTMQIISDADTPFEKATAIETYLADNFGYTLSPPHTPDNVDFVDHFLFSLERGYCTYFATAMAIMGRIANLPTRYVEGFSMPMFPNAQNIYEIRQSNAHAWVEVYFAGVGWLTFDPSPPIDYYFAERGYVPGAMGNQLYFDYMNPYWERMYEMWMTPGTGIPVITGADTVSAQDVAHEPLNPLVLITLISTLLLAGVIALSIGVVARRRIKRMKREKLPYKARLRCYYADILWLLTLYEYPLRPGETPYVYAKRVDTWLVNDHGTMMDICSLMVKNEFGYYDLTGDDISQASRFIKNLEDNIKYVLGRSKFMVLLLTKEFSNSNEKH